MGSGRCYDYRALRTCKPFTLPPTAGSLRRGVHLRLPGIATAAILSHLLLGAQQSPVSYASRVCLDFGFWSSCLGYSAACPAWWHCIDPPDLLLGKANFRSPGGRLDIMPGGHLL